jgi:MFS family permease
MPSDSGGQMRVFVALFITTLFVFLAIGAVVPTLPRYIRGPLHQSDIAVGVAMGAFALTSVFLRPIGGRLSDRVGRQPVFASGGALMAVAGVLYLVPLQLPGLILARLILGIGEGWLYTSAVVWVLDTTPPSRRGGIIGWYGMSIWLGLSFGPVVGELLHAAAGYSAVWTFAAIAPAFAALISFTIPKPPIVGVPIAPSRLWQREAVIPGIALWCSVVGFAAMQSFMILMLGRRGIGHGPAIFTIFAASVAVSRLAISGLPDRIGAATSATIAALVHAAGLALLAVADNLGVAVVAVIVMGAGYSALFPSLALMVVERNDESRRGATIGVFTAFVDAGMGVGAPLAGVIAALSGYGGMFVASAALATVGAVIVGFRRHGPRAPHPATLDKTDRIRT